MISNILIAIILLLLTSTFLCVNVWKKRNFVKELYVEPFVSAAYFAIAFVFSVGIIIAYLIYQQTSTLHWSGLFLVLVSDLPLMGAYAITATTCVYLDGNTLVKKSIFYTKRILIDKNTKIVEKIDRRIIQSEKNTISIEAKGLTGKMNTLIYRIKQIIGD